MILGTKGKRSCLVLLLYLGFATVASFAFIASETFSFANLNTGRLSSGVFFPTIVHAANGLADEVAIVRRTYEHSLSALRNRLLRIFILTGIYAIAMEFTGACFRVAINVSVPIKKNTILLKLRI